MNTTLTAAILLASLVAVVLLGRSVRRHLPDHHLSADSKDAVKLAMGLVATMTALLLGLLVSSAKGTYDTQRIEVIQMAAKVAFLDRVLAAYGPEAAEVSRPISQCHRRSSPAHVAARSGRPGPVAPQRAGRRRRLCRHPAHSPRATTCSVA